MDEKQLELWEQKPDRISAHPDLKLVPFWRLLVPPLPISNDKIVLLSNIMFVGYFLWIGDFLPPLVVSLACLILMQTIGEGPSK